MKYLGKMKIFELYSKNILNYIKVGIMRLLLIIFTSIAIITLSANELFAYGKAYISGRLQTVSTDGLFDVIRNPAILTTQKEDNSFGVGLLREAFNSYDIMSSIDTDASFPDPIGPIIVDNVYSDQSIDIDISKTLSINGALAYTRKISDNLFMGLAVSEMSEREERNIRFETSAIINGTISTNPLVMNISSVNNTIQEVSSNKTNFYSSFGYKIIKNLSAGLQANFEYIYDKSIEDSENFEVRNTYINNNPLPTEFSEYYNYSEQITKTISATIGLGFLYNTKEQDIGLVVSSGKYSFIKQKYNHRSEDMTNYTLEYDISDSTPYKGVYVENAGITAGYRRQVTSFFGIALEAGCGLPRKYKETFLKADESREAYYEEEKTIEKKVMYRCNGGFEFNMNKNMTIGIGGVYYNFKLEEEVERDNTTEVTDIDVDVFIGTFGVDHRITKNSKITISTEFQRFKYDIGMRSSNVIQNYKMELSEKNKVNQFNMGLAFALYF